MEDASIFNRPLVYFTANLYILRSSELFYGNMVYFSSFWYIVPRTIWQPCFNDLFFRSQVVFKPNRTSAAF
jgi:hypothetical protein